MHPRTPSPVAAGALCLALLALAAGCAAEAQPLEVTYYYLPG